MQSIYVGVDAGRVGGGGGGCHMNSTNKTLNPKP